MIEDILLVPYIDLGNFPNDLHLQLNQTQDEQMDAEFDVDNPAPGKLATAIADHKAAVATENSAYIVSRSSEYTEQIAEQDAIRDTKIDEATSVANAMAKVASLPQMQQAAQVWLRGWNVYKPNPKSAYEAETTAIQQWYEDYQADADQQQAAQTLGITQIIADMVQANNEVHRLIVLRENTQGQQQNTSISLKDARQATDKAYKWMIPAGVLPRTREGPPAHKQARAGEERGNRQPHVCRLQRLDVVEAGSGEREGIYPRPRAERTGRGACGRAPAHHFGR